MATALGNVTIGQDLVQQTRVGIVTFNADATIVARLTRYTLKLDFLNDLMGLSAAEVDEVNISA